MHPCFIHFLSCFFVLFLFGVRLLLSAIRLVRPPPIHRLFGLPVVVFGSSLDRLVMHLATSLWNTSCVDFWLLLAPHVVHEHTPKKCAI